MTKRFSLVRAIDMSRLKIPLVFSTVSAGFPSPADDYIETCLSLDDLIIKNPSTTFFIRVEGESMVGAGIYPHDILVVDKSQSPKNNDVIVAVLEGAFTVKRFIKIKDAYALKAENPTYPLIPLNEHSDFMVWGVVITVIHQPYVL